MAARSCSRRYVPKPEPHGYFHDTPELRKREKMGPQEHFLDARVVGQPEAAHRTWGYHMRSGTGVVHLCTKPPHLRMRALPRSANDEEDDDSGDEGEGDDARGRGRELSDASFSGSDSAAEDEPAANASEPLKFMDGTIEQYENRPRDDEDDEQSRTLPGTSPDGTWESILYPDFHRYYRVVLGRNIPKSNRRAQEQREYWRCTRGGDVADGGEAAEGGRNGDGITLSAHYVVPRQARSKQPLPVAVDWLEPDRHGDRYFYHQLLLKTPFRNSMPSSFVSDNNVSGTLREALELSRDAEGSAILETTEGGLAALLERDACKQLRSTEQRDAMRERLKHHEAALAAMENGDLDTMQAAAQNGMEAEDLERLRADIATTTEDINGAPTPLPLPPDVRYRNVSCFGKSERIATWHEAPDKVWRLRRRQLIAYELLQDAGDKQILSFLSGEGGMGKSLLIRLLVQYWRSQGKRVLVCASTAKAARLIRGHTVHHAFKLSTRNGGFITSRLDGEKHSPHWAWLYSRDIIVIDEISMLSASTLHGVNHALNHVMSLTASATSHDHFGLKSVLAVGDLFQLPAVEKFKFHDQIYMSTLWPAFRYLYLDESCRQDDTERRFAELLSRLRLGAEHLTPDDIALLKTRVCSSRGHGSSACCTFADKVEKRTRDGRRRKRRVCGLSDTLDGDDADNTFTTTQCRHCEIKEDATVIAALVSKVNELNTRHEAKLEAAGTNVLRADAVDRTTGGTKLTDERSRCAVDKRARGQLRVLGVYVGMRALLTQNEDMETDRINGSPGVVVAIETDPDDTDEPVVICFRPDSAANDAPPLRIARTLVRVSCVGVGHVSRYQFALLPSHAITVHRVQGSTLEKDIHILVNAEFFAPGQCYTALSRARYLSQLHLWRFDLSAIKAEPRVAREYKRLERRALTRAHIEAARPRVTQTLPHLSTLAAA